MNPIHPLLHGSIASLIAIGLAGVANTALAAKGDTEKCAGVTKAGKNDCGTSKSACAGTATVDRRIGHSHLYGLRRLGTLAGAAGWRHCQFWTDARAQCAVHVLEFEQPSRGSS